uniref:F-box/LRR-repeat protein 15/At3g58940/PEG3-like LRR domain-containing protein n=1 Tax=Aegilops tauschii TaxID=37682 RepID=M8AS81_AEGTA
MAVCREGFRRSTPPLPHGARSRHDPDGGVDLISALPDDMLLLVLARLRCVRAAAQTSLLSRRWRGIWTGLTDLTLSDLKPSAIEAALARFNAAPTRFAASPPVSTVNISLSERYAAHASSLLRAAVRLSAEELVFTFQRCHMAERAIIVLPYFRRATSIELDIHSHRIDPPRECYAGSFSALQKLSLSGNIIHLGFLLSRCPRLRVIKLTGSTTDDIMVHSATLEDLDISTDTGCNNIDIVAPVLKILQLKFHVGWNNIRMSISTPMVEKVSWRCSYPMWAFSFGFLSLENLAIGTKERHVHTGNDTCSQAQQLSRFYGLHLRISATSYSSGPLNFVQEIQKLPVTNFPLLELSFIPSLHVYAALVMHLLQISWIGSSTKMLKVIHIEAQVWSKVRETCQGDCPCDEPKNWRSQSISLTCLEEFEITGFSAKDHEHDFLTLILRCSPTLKRVTLTLQRREIQGPGYSTPPPHTVHTPKARYKDADAL